MRRKGVVRALCVSERRGTPKRGVEKVSLTPGWGVAGDAHGGDWHRQVSLLAAEAVDAFNARGADVKEGAFGENVLVAGIELNSLPVGARLRLGSALVEITQIGKECHGHCAIRERMGDCVMPREGVFSRVIEGGDVRVGDAAEALPRVPGAPRAGIVTVSDRAHRGERPDESGPLARQMLHGMGWTVEAERVLADERMPIEQALIDLCDRRGLDAVFTTGGTGFAPRDVTPEATLAVAERLAPGIAEALRAHSMTITPRAMFGRGVSVIRGRTLIVNLPGSPAAVREHLEYLLPILAHAIETLRGEALDCAPR